MSPDPYDILELTPDAGTEQVRRAFRRLARQLHPDLHPDDPDTAERFRLVAEAYETLSNPRTRAEFDREHPDEQAVNPPPTDPGEASVFQESGRRWATDGQDVVTVLDLDLVTSIAGGPVPVRVTGPVACGLCEGSGFDPTGSAVTCWTCEGTGQVSYTNRFGESIGLCLTCGGEKIQPAEECNVCRGSGTVVGVRTVATELPIGVDDGDMITVPGQGGPSGRGGRPGDLLVVIQIHPHPVYTRSGLDLEIVVPITFAEAASGSEITIPTLGGEFALTIPPGTQGGTTITIKGMGISSVSDRGDLRVAVHIAVPTGLTAAEHHLVAGLPGETGVSLRQVLFADMS